MSILHDDNVSEPLVTVAWGGDVNIGRRFHYAFTEMQGKDALAAIAPLRDADLTIINLECVVALAGACGIEKNERASYYYRARPETLQTLLNGGVDLVATANNHSGDYGPEALLEQAGWLDSAGIGHAGSGATLEEALQPVLRSVGDLTIALFSLDATQASFAADDETAGHAYLPLNNPQRWREVLEPRIAEARQHANIVLVAIHWGANRRPAPDQFEIKVGHAVIDAGADAILGASAHCLQAIEIYKNRPIIHDAGDLLFDAIRRDDKDSGIFTLTLDHSGVKQVVFTPLLVEFCQTTQLQGDEAQQATRRFVQKCASLGTVLQEAADGCGFLELNPPMRSKRILPKIVPKQATILTAAAPKPEWIAEEVPEAARLAQPVRLGPLELLGVTLSPSTLDKQGLFFVESYWRLAEPTDVNWRIDFSAQSPELRSFGRWGVSCDHDPCDWMWPTSRWSENVIYRDFYNLRPPTITRWKDVQLQLSVGLKANAEHIAPVKLPVEARLVLSPKEAFAVLRANPPKYHVPQKDKIAPLPQILWTAQQIEQITGGRWLTKPPKHWYVGSISHKSNMIMHDDMPEPRFYVATDKRLVARHELYSDLGGKHWDSHSKLLSIQDKLNGGMVVENVAGLDPAFPLLKLEDPLNGLMQLGVAGRERLQGHVVAITGSAGKTSLASMLSQSMAVDMQVRSNAATNYNSRVGLLHLLANTPPTTDLVVMEVAVSAINAPNFQNIKLVRPDIAIITNIAPSHLPAGKGLDYIAQRKANIFRGVAKGGWAVIYRETAYFDYICQFATQFGLQIMTYGEGKDADIRLDNYDHNSGMVHAQLLNGQSILTQLAAKGKHMAINSLACLAVRKILGGSLDDYLPSLSLFEAEPGRGQTSVVRYQDKTITVIDESYNANPLSMHMSLSLMENVSARKVLVLGDMLELGDNAQQYHLDLVELVLKLQPDCVLSCGKLMQRFHATMQERNSGSMHGKWFENSKALMADIDRWLQDGDRILIKGSNSIGLGALVGQLKKS